MAGRSNESLLSVFMHILKPLIKVLHNTSVINWQSGGQIACIRLKVALLCYLRLLLSKGNYLIGNLVSTYVEEKIMFDVIVDEIEYGAVDHDDLKTQTVIVKGHYTNSHQPFEEHGDAVIITAPLHTICHIKFVAKKSTPPPEQLNNFLKALDDIWPLPGTKIMIQCKDRFWEAKGIKGEFSNTTLPIGQVHYPTYTENSPSKKGILMCYSWKYEAYSLAALKPQMAVREAVRQIAEIHPQIKEKFEVGVVQAWTNEPLSPGMYVVFKPHQYLTVRELVMYPCLNMFFAGEGISFTVGWIQGALQSGLRAAYQFYSRNENNMQHRA